MAEVLHTISLPVLVRPIAPAGLQNAPGVTPVRIDGAVVRGVLVVRVAVGFGRGLVVVRVAVGFGRGLVVAFDGGLAEVGVGEAGAVAAMIGLALAAGAAAGLSSSRAEPIPPHAHSRARRPANTPRIFLFSRARAAAWAGVSPDGSGRFGFFTGRVCRVRASRPHWPIRPIVLILTVRDSAVAQGLPAPPMPPAPINGGQECFQ
ncbi:hypothetical protein ACIG6B_30195 [Bacillus mobilis]|uniref:hypothetical protein n=1 Tax=Bacillus mobilis TaxID=2026190 RepID=UPI0037C60F11